MLLATLLNGLAEAMVQFEQEGLQAFVPRWNALHAYAGQQVFVLDGATVLHEGVAVGIDANGRLIMDTEQGCVAVMAGDVSLRPQET